MNRIWHGSKKVMLVFGAGLIFGIGLRISEWLIPAPPTKLVLCDDSSSEQCEVVTEDASDQPAALAKSPRAEVI